MKKIQGFNDYALEELRKLNNTNEISNPLLVSPKAKGKIMYIGQETNGWFESLNDSNYSARELEDFYVRYFLNGRVRNTLFWRFIKDVVENDDLASSVVWTNALIVGKDKGVGCPRVNSEIKDLSVENLITIYECFDIKKIICAAGPCNPYYDVYTTFLKEIGKNINDYPRNGNPLAYSDCGDAIYINHPQYLWRKSIYYDVLGKSKEFIKK